MASIVPKTLGGASQFNIFLTSSQMGALTIESMC